MTRWLLCLLLLGCAQQTAYQPVDVAIPVATGCDAGAIQAPAWPLQNTDTTEPLFEKVKSALAELELRKAFETRLQAAVKACE